MRVEIALAEPGDAELLTPRLRAADVAELTAASGPDILGCLVDSVAMSKGRLGRMAFSLRRDGELVCLFGFVPQSALSDVAYPWLVGSDAFTDVARMRISLARDYCVAALSEYPVLVNYVDARNRASLVWLKRLGFTIQSPEPFGLASLPFHRFEMRLK